MTKVYQIYGTTAVGGVQNSLAYIQIQRPGKLKYANLQVSCDGAMNSGAQRVEAELSFSSVNALAVNDPVGPIIAIESCNDQLIGMAADGIARRDARVSSPELDIAVKTGDRIYMHVDNATTGPSPMYAKAMLYVEE